MTDDSVGLRPSPGTRADEMLSALNELERIRDDRKYVLGHAGNHLHLAIVEMQRATADVLLRERQKAAAGDAR